MILFSFSISLSSPRSPFRLPECNWVFFLCVYGTPSGLFLYRLNLGWLWEAGGRAGGSEREKKLFYFRFRIREINYGAARREHEKQPASLLFGQLRNEMFNIDKNAKQRVWYRKGLWLAPINHADERWVSQWVIAFNDQEKKHEQRRAKKERLEAKIYSLFIPCRAFLCSTSSWNVFFSASFIKTREKYVLMKFHSCFSTSPSHSLSLSRRVSRICCCFWLLRQHVTTPRYLRIWGFITKQTVDNEKKCLFAEDFVSLKVRCLEGRETLVDSSIRVGSAWKPDRLLILHRWWTASGAKGRCDSQIEVTRGSSTL